MRTILLLLATAALVGQNGIYADETMDTGMPERASYARRPHRDHINLQELGFGSGYGWSDLKEEKAPGQTENQGDYEYVPLYLHFGYDINSIFQLQDSPATLQFALEPFVNPISDPDNDFEVGLEFMTKFSYPILHKTAVYIEAGSGPMYFGVDTYEQGEKGFAFSNIGGAGLQYFFEENKAFHLGYRYRHISSAGTRDENGGINVQTVVGGFSVFY